MSDLPGGIVYGPSYFGGSYAPPAWYGPGGHLPVLPYYSFTYQGPYVPIVAGPQAGETPEWKGAVGSWYSRFWVVLGPDFGTFAWTPLRMPFVLGYPTTLGSTATPEEIAAVKRQILKWKAPHAYPVKVILKFPGVILMGERGLKMPFRCHDFGGLAPTCTWQIGKLMNDTLGNMPFVMGGYKVSSHAE